MVVEKLDRRELPSKLPACVETCEPVAEPHQLFCRFTAHSSESPDSVNVSGAIVAPRSGDLEDWRELTDRGRRRVPPTSRGSPGGGVVQLRSGDLEDWRELTADGGRLLRQCSPWNNPGGAEPRSAEEDERAELLLTGYSSRKTGHV